MTDNTGPEDRADVIERHAKRNTADQVKELTDRLEVAEGALAKVNAIRNSIIGLQKMNWSEHIYPLVAALEGADIKGMEYPEARANVGILLDRATTAEAALAEARKVLEPFAKQNETFHPSWHREMSLGQLTESRITLTIGDIRAARAWLQANKGEA